MAPITCATVPFSVTFGRAAAGLLLVEDLAAVAIIGS
jgi:hypothetical protein